MIYGDPYIIAFQFDSVDEWNETGSPDIKGIFTIYIDGDVFFGSSESVILNRLFPLYARGARNSALMQTSRSHTAIRSKTDEYNRIYRKLHANGRIAKLAGFFDLSSPPLQAEGKYLFAILGEKDVIFYGNAQKGDYAILPQGGLVEVMANMRDYPLFSGGPVTWGETYHYYTSHHHE